MIFNELTTPAKNMMLSGYIFMNTTWIQNQMVYLLILSKNKDIIDDFVGTPEILPKKFVEIRSKYWEKMFAEVKKEFIDEYRQYLSDEDLNYIEKIYMLRNMLAHAQVSVGRDHMFYRPANEKAEKKFLEVMEVSPEPCSARPYLIKIDFNNDDILLRTSIYIEKVGVEIMGRLSEILKVPHYQIR